MATRRRSPRRTGQDREDEDELDDDPEAGDPEAGDWDDLFDGVPEASDAAALYRGLAFGFLAMTPLFAAYELGTADGARRAAAELVLTRPLAPFVADLQPVRLLLLAGLGLAALVFCLRRDLRLGPRLVRVPVEGFFGALLFGPLTALLLQVVDAAPLGLGAEVQGPVPSLERAAFVAGAAAYEEVVFRVGLFSLLWLVTRRVVGWCGGSDRAARWSAECAAPVLSALLFSAFHLEVVLRPFGPGGEPFHTGLFLWRALAGFVLALVFRLRGPGVAAWIHACFNVASLLGAGPRVFL